MYEILIDFMDHAALLSLLNIGRLELGLFGLGISCGLGFFPRENIIEIQLHEDIFDIINAQSILN
jgi:hypothetical protein